MVQNQRHFKTSWTYSNRIKTFNQFLALKFSQDFLYSVEVEVTLSTDLSGPDSLCSAFFYYLVYNLDKRKNIWNISNISVMEEHVLIAIYLSIPQILSLAIWKGDSCNFIQHHDPSVCLLIPKLVHCFHTHDLWSLPVFFLSHLT